MHFRTKLDCNVSSLLRIDSLWRCKLRSDTQKELFTEYESAITKKLWTSLVTRDQSYAYEKDSHWLRGIRAQGNGQPFRQWPANCKLEKPHVMPSERAGCQLLHLQWLEYVRLRGLYLVLFRSRIRACAMNDLPLSAGAWRNWFMSHWATYSLKKNLLMRFSQKDICEHVVVPNANFFR